MNPTIINIQLTEQPENATPESLEHLALQQADQQRADWYNSSVQISVNNIVIYAKAVGKLIGVTTLI